MTRRSSTVLACAASVLAVGLSPSGPARAQLLGGVGDVLRETPLGPPTAPLGGSPVLGGTSGNVDDLVSGLDHLHVTDTLDAPTLSQIRRQRLRALVEANRRVLEMDRSGNPVRRGEIIVLDPTPEQLMAAGRAGFAVIRRETVDSAGVAVAVLTPPRGRDAVKGLAALQALLPGVDAELNPVFEPAGGGDPRGALAARGQATAPAAHRRGPPIGMIDGGVAAHRSLAGAAIEQRGFAPGGPRASGHGTAIASLIVGDDGPFHGAAPGRTLLVADVYGGQPAAGSAEAIALGLSWLAGRGARVITISLVGPPDRLLERSIAGVRARGVLVVAAVGNDGPAAPPQYPAAYPGVVAVTGVDAHDRPLLEAGRAAHLDFAAPGADMAAASLAGGYVAVRGTSFAAPLVAARLALAPGDAAEALRAVAAEARPARGLVGRGVVCGYCRVTPRSVGARTAS